MRSICAATFITLFVVAHAAHGQDAPRVPADVFNAPVVQLHAAAFDVPRAARPPRALLLSMYVSHGALQGYDVYSTRKALKSGGVEANPAMKFAAKSSAGLIAVKAGVSAFTIFTAERLWRNDHRGQAIAAMLISNGVMVLVAANNHGVLERLR